MARKRILFFYQLPTALKYLILGLSLTVVIVLCQVQAKSQTSANLEQSQAQLLNQQGFEELNKGQPQAALQTWKAAYNIYYKLKDSDGIAGSLINQSLALQASGSYLSACQTISKILELEDWICSSPIELREISQQAYLETLKFALEKQPFSRVRIIGLRNLGDVLRLIGNPEASSIILFNAMAMAETLDSKQSDIYNQILLSLGNTERALYIQAKGKYQLTDDVFTKQKSLKKLKSKAQNALKFYQELAGRKQNVLPLQAKINQLSLILEIEKWKSIVILENPTTNEYVQTLVNSLLSRPERFESFPAIESIYAQLNIAQSLVQIDQDIQLKQLVFSRKDNPLSISLILANKASSFQQLHNHSAKFQNSNILIGGISQPSPSLNDPSVPKNLPALPEVKAEIENIKKNTTSVLTLIDSDFNSRSFQQKIEKNSFSLVHLSTHAQFSSDPEQTFVLTWDKPLNVKDLKFLLKNEGDTINLLVLSACQTAKGDKRSALGIAGIAVQAGARSTLASLWLVDADSTALLMEEFYKGLKNGLVLPEALRLAKLSLLSSEKYFHPYYWAGFILVGN